MIFKSVLDGFPVDRAIIHNAESDGSMVLLGTDLDSIISGSIHGHLTGSTPCMWLGQARRWPEAWQASGSANIRWQGSFPEVPSGTPDEVLLRNSCGPPRMATRLWTT